MGWGRRVRHCKPAGRLGCASLLDDDTRGVVGEEAHRNEEGNAQPDSHLAEGLGQRQHACFGVAWGGAVEVPRPPCRLSVQVWAEHPMLGERQPWGGSRQRTAWRAFPLKARFGTPGS